jgi:hypothetical protein
MDTIINGKEVTRTKVVYTYDELSDKAKKAVVERVREVEYECINSYEVEETIQDHVLSVLTESATWDKLSDLKIEFSLNHCQGDGVAFYGRLYRNDAPRLNWGILQDNVGLQEVRLVRNSHGNHYSHYNCFNLEFYNEDGDLIGTDGGSRNDIVVYLKEDMTSSLAGTSDTDKMTAGQLAMWQCMTDINKALRQLSKDCERVGYQVMDDMTSEQSALDWIECDSQPRKYDVNGVVTDMVWWE